MKACRALLCKLPFHLLRFVQRMAGKNFAGAGRSNVRSARSACSEAMAERAEAKGAGGGGAGARFIVYWTRCSATALVDTPLAAAWSREILPLYPLIDSVSRSCRGGDEKRRSFLVAFALLRGASLFDVACSFLSLVVRQGSRLPTEATLLLSAACG